MSSKYAPSRKVIAAILVAAVGTVGLLVFGHPSQEALVAVWAPVAAAYGISD